MLEIKKNKTKFGDYFEIITDQGSFEIILGGNFDLYWKYNYNGKIFDVDDSKDFFITKENYFLFQLFEQLYHRVQNYEIFYLEEMEHPEFYSDLQKQLIEDELNNPKRLFKNGRIEWHCDDFPYNEASMFTIEKLEDAYKLTFYKSKNKSFISYFVQLRNFESRYDPFHILFMEMYLKLCTYEPSYHQIHMEEYLYQQNLIKKKEKK